MRKTYKHKLFLISKKVKQTKLTDVKKKRDSENKKSVKTEENRILTAEELSKEYRQVSVATFFEKNKHILGYDNPSKALLTVIKEGCDNSLDATDEARILPEILVEVHQLSEDRFRVVIEDNGPGIVKQYIPKVFGILLYGSKFHRLRQNRGVQGIGISSAVLYAQLTTGKAAKITSKISTRKKAYYCELLLDTHKNEPEVVKEEDIEWDKPHGVRVELEIEAKYQKGKQSIDQYLKQVAVANPHLHLIYKNPLNEKTVFPRVVETVPKEPKQIKPHPYGVELGILMRMLKATKARTLQAFLKQDFCRVSSKVAKEICEKAGLYENARPSRIAREEADKLFRAIQNTKIMAPPTDCLSPLSEDLILKGLKKEFNTEFYTAITRPASVYRGFPFLIEAGLCYGGDLPAEELIKVLRFANKVPLLYQQSAGAIFKSLLDTNWRNYGLSKSKGALPTGPLVVMIHMASVWVPFTSESKEAIAHYPEIIKEMKLALQECGRQLSIFIRRRKKKEQEAKKKSYIEMYLPHIGIALKDILNLKELQEKKVEKILKNILETSRE